MFLPRLCLGLGLILVVQGADEVVLKDTIVFTEPVSWWDAKQACLSLDGQLSSLQTEKELQETLEKMKSEKKSEVWIGGTHIKGKPSWIGGDNGQFHRSDHKFFHTWDSENCLVLLDSNKIVDRNCGITKASACRRSNVECPEGWFNLNRKCLKFVTTNTSNKDARKVCTVDNPDATMATISSIEEEKAVSKMTQSGGFYVGLYRSAQDTNGQFVWADQMELVWKEPIEANTTLPDVCTFINKTSGDWMAESCNPDGQEEVLCQIVSRNLLDRLIFPVPVESFLQPEETSRVPETTSIAPMSTDPSIATTTASEVTSISVSASSEQPAKTTAPTKPQETSLDPTDTTSSDVSNATVPSSPLPVSVTMETSSAQLINSQDPSIQAVELDTKLGNVSLSVGLGTFFVIVALIAVIAYITYYKKIRPARQFGFRSFDDSFA